MTLSEIKQAVDRYLDSKNLKNPNIRKNALRKVLGFISIAYTHSAQVFLPSDKNELKDSYGKYKGYTLSGAESSVINHIYELFPSSFGQGTVAVKTKPAINKTLVVEHQESVDYREIEKKLIYGTFTPVNSLNEKNIPMASGIYCIRLRKGVVFPVTYGKIREDGIIYIGIATESLFERLWNEELNCHSPATFFRSIGAMLGCMPPKGSLYGKSTRNYKFSDPDEEKIRVWMRRSLLVNYVLVKKSDLNDIEDRLIKKYMPLENIKGNPQASVAIKEARRRCLEFAREERE